MEKPIETVDVLVGNDLEDFMDWLQHSDCPECSTDIQEMRDKLVEHGLLRQKQAQDVELRSFC